MEYMQDDLTEAHAEEENGKIWSNIILMQARKKIDELTLERDTLKLDVEGLHLMMVKHHWQKTKEWIKTCKEMTDCIQNYVANLTTQVHEAIQEFNANPERKLPWKIYKLLKYFQDLTKSFSTE